MPSCCEHDHNKVDQAVEKHHEHSKCVSFGGDKRLMYFGVIALIVIIGGVAWGLLGAGKTDPSSVSSSGGASKIVLEPSQWDAGEISMANGKYSRTVTVKNSGDAPLKIMGVQTSCMCTSASLTVNSEKSPAFGMPGHGRAPLWDGMEIAPGAEGQLEIIFDPLAHGPDATGKVVREVYLRTNDPKNKEAVVKFTANVVK